MGLLLSDRPSLQIQNNQAKRNHDMHVEYIAENKVLVHKKSMMTGKINNMLLPTNQGVIEYWLASGDLIQNVMPDLSAEQREFLMSGMTPEEWDEEFGYDEELDEIY